MANKEQLGKLRQLDKTKEKLRNLRKLEQTKGTNWVVLYTVFMVFSLPQDPGQKTDQNSGQKPDERLHQKLEKHENQQTTRKSN